MKTNIVSDLIPYELAEMLVIDDAKPGNIYSLTNIHKNMTPPPGRPIRNTINTPTMNLSKWVDIQLQPLVKKYCHLISKIVVTSYIK